MPRVMDTAHWDQLSALFLKAASLDVDERRIFLDKACSNFALRQELDELLAMHEEGGLTHELNAAVGGALASILEGTEPTPGQVISHYRILDRLGGGGMGVVFRAVDIRLGRIVALKFLPSHLQLHEEAKQRFIQEAKAISRLDHPNICTLYEADETARQQLFIAMAFYEGETLKDKIARGYQSVDEVIAYSIQILEGLTHAHEAGIIHRDIKPANILVTTTGLVKLLDFGIAKVTDAQLTRTGTTLGTIAYMSPEQLRGEIVDERTDLWSLGVVLYEILTGKRPFQGENEATVLYAILNHDPELIIRDRKEMSPALDDFVHRLLAKDREQRIHTAREALEQLSLLRTSRTEEISRDFSYLFQLPEGPGSAAELILLPQIEQLAERGDYQKAFELARYAEKHLPGNSKLARLLHLVSDVLTIKTHPEGACVSLIPFEPVDEEVLPDPIFQGVTPIEDLRISRGDYLLLFEKEGYEPVERVVSSALNRVEQSFGIPAGIQIEATLLELGSIPKDMVLVPGGKYQLVGVGAPTRTEVDLVDFLLDKYTVTNAQFKAFIQAGGYANRNFWKYPFKDAGRVLSFDEAQRRFVDKTGLPGPRCWISQEYPEGHDRHPVTCITWYEAAAYAAFAGKRLPTIFEWEKAARNGAFTHFEGAVMPWGWVSAGRSCQHRANFLSHGTVPVDSYPFGISPFGAYNMAGNVKEWCANELEDGQIFTGGSWEDPMYLFAAFGGVSGFHASPALGFRCCHTYRDLSACQGGDRITMDTHIPSYDPVDEETYALYLSHYLYDKQSVQDELIERIDRPDWIREKLRLSVPGTEEILAYLYLPKRAVSPYQCIVYVPGVNVFYEQSISEQVEWIMAPHIKSGRAVFSIVMKGMVERSWVHGHEWPDPSSVRFRSEMVNHATELRRSVDYLSSRQDIDSTRLAYAGFSWGSGSRALFAAVEERPRAVVFIGGGIEPRLKNARPEASSINFVPYIRRPTLMVSGSHDEEFPYYTCQLPLYNLLREPKKMVRVDGGHLPAPEARVPAINFWLDEILGPVTHLS